MAHTKWHADFMVVRVGITALALLAGVAGFLVTFANRWAADTSGGCRDTFTSVVGSCVAPGSPPWALTLGTAAPMAAVLGVVLALRSHDPSPERTRDHP